MDIDQIEEAAEALMNELAVFIQGKPALSAVIALSYMASLVTASQSAKHPEHAPSYLRGWQSAAEQGTADGMAIADLADDTHVAQNAPSSSTVN